MNATMRRAAGSMRIVTAAAALLALGAAAQAQPKIDHAKVVGSEACASCHAEAHAAWGKTHHFKSQDELKNGKDIADKLGLANFRREGTCVECHTTLTIVEAKPKAVSGVSCESCHGAAADWIKIHNDYGAGATAETETAEHKAERHKKADEAGMVRKDRVDLIAANCFSCHTVPNQELVNKGGHKAGSDFELVGWSQGEVRHNYFGSKVNEDATPERKRLLYVLGKAKDLEYAMRGAQLITEKGDYQKSMLGRSKQASIELDAILKAVDIPEYSAMLKDLARGEDGSLKLSKDLIATMPDKLAAASAEFQSMNDGSKLAAVDALIPGPDTYKGTPAP